MLFKFEIFRRAKNHSKKFPNYNQTSFGGIVWRADFKFDFFKSKTKNEMLFSIFARNFQNILAI